VEHVNIIITDLPYGDTVQWSNNQDQEKAVERLLNNLLTILGYDYSLCYTLHIEVIIDRGILNE